MIKKKKASLFVGRWQPFHKGHKKLIESVLKKGKSVVIAIRDTDIDKDNPFSLSERWTMIQKSLKKYGELVKIITLPDIDEICYGRSVGYDIRRIDLDGETEKISATKIRGKRIKYNPIIWITGQTGAGKTTIARALQREIGGVILDGDEMRNSISVGAGFSKKDRTEHNYRVARLARVLSKNTIVVVSVIAPFELVRKKIDKMISPVWIYVKRNLPKEKDKPYEPPKKPHVLVDTDTQITKKQLNIITSYLKKNKILKKKNL